MIGESEVARAIGGKYADVDLVRFRARAAITALEAAGLLMKWRPIETALKDGHRLWLAGRWKGIPWTSAGHWDPFSGEWRTDDGVSSLLNAAHWMPLPAPPAQNGDEVKG